MGSVGTRCYVLLYLADDNDALLLQVKEARPSVLEPYTGRSITSDAFDQALVRFARSYADQTERDHAALVKAVKSGRVQAATET